MNRQLVISSVLGLCLIGAGALLLQHVSRRQTLAPPGVKTHPLAGSIRLEADLPERVLAYDSTLLETDSATLGTLPRDTSFGQRRYRAADGFWMDLRVVLMGRDRTSMHKPQFCLTGQGWQIDELASRQTLVHVKRPYDYDLPVVELIAHNTASIDGQKQPISGVYVYWYVADDAMSASTSGVQRMYLLAARLLKTGVLQRWAYVSCFAPCLPGQENSTLERVQSFIAAAVPEFQLYPRTSVAVNSAP